VNRFLAHVRDLAGPPSTGAGPASGRWGWWLPLLPFVAWPLYCLSIGERRWEHAVMLLLPPLLAWGNRASHRMFVGILPLLLTGLIYDAMRFVKNAGLTPERVHVCDIHALDAKWFGIGGQAWPDIWLQHDNLAFDLLFALPYGTFIFVTVAYAVWLYRADYDGMRQFAWTFLFTNIAGFLTYHIYPAAPPWWFHAHGCTVDLLARASEGTHLLRVDQWLGVPYFQGFYSRSNDIFGAVPSLHVSYPLLVVLVGWPRHRALGRTLACTFYASMMMGAVYLDHHWVFDVVLGSMYTVVVYAVVRRAIQPSRQAALEPAEWLGEPIT
jgi:hypothetical protein